MTLPNLYHLKYFADAAELGSVSAAARKNLVSHPAISQAIKSLEAQLDLKLLSHRKKSFEITPAGRALALRARTLLGSVPGLVDATPHADSEITGTVVLGMSRSIAHAFLSPLLARLSEHHPKVRLKVRFGTTSEMIERTVQGLTDLSVTIGHQAMPTLRQSLLLEGQFVQIQPAQRKGRKPPAGERKGFVLTKPQYETEALKKSYHQHYKEHLPVLLEVGSWDVIAQLISDGHGYGLVPDVSITADRRGKIKKLPAPWFKCGYEVYLNEGTRNPKGTAKDAVAKHVRELMRDRRRS